MMKAYKRLTVVQLRELCEERRIEHAGLKKAALIEVLEQHDLQNDILIEEENDVESNDGEVDLGQSRSDERGDLDPTEMSHDLTQIREGESESVTAMRLRLALIQAERDRELAAVSARERDWRIEKERLEMRTAYASANNNNNVNCDAREIKMLLPVMSDNDVLSFFLAFEKVMQLNEIDRGAWAKYLPSQLTPKAQKTYTRLNLEDSRDYNKVKESIMASYQLTPDTYFRMFCNLRRTGSMTYAMFMSNLRDILMRYCESRSANDFQSLFDCVLEEQFRSALPSEVRAFVLSHQKTCKTVDEFASLADLAFSVKKAAESDGRSNVSAEYRGYNYQLGAARPQFRPPVPGGKPNIRPDLSGVRTANNDRFNWRGNANGGKPRTPAYNPSQAQYSRSHRPAFLAHSKSRTLNECYECDANELYGEHENLHDCDKMSDCEDSAINFDGDFVIPLYVDNVETSGIRDSGCVAPLLVSTELVNKDKINYQKCIALKGVFDRNRVHNVPTAKVKVRSPCFGYEREVTVTAGVVSLPTGVNCLIGNALFKQHPQLTDVIVMQKQSACQTPDSDTDKRTCTEELTGRQRSGQDVTERQTNLETPVTERPEYVNGKSRQVKTERSQTGDRNADIGLNSTALTRQSSELINGGNTEVKQGNDVKAPCTDTVDSDRLPAYGKLIDIAMTPVTEGSSMLNPSDTDIEAPTQANVVTRQKARQIGHTKTATEGSTGQQPSVGATPSDMVSDVVKNAVEADEISRLCAIDMSDERTEVENNRRTEFTTMQRNDPSLKHWWVRATNGSSELKIFDGLLYKRIPDSVTSPQYEYALVVPEQFQKEVIQKAHDALLSGHLGTRKTEKRILGVFAFPKMRKKIKQHIKCCHRCQMISPIRTSERQPMQNLDVNATHAFQDLSLDIMGPSLPVTKRKNRYVMCVICNLTKFVHIIALQNLRADTIAQKLLEMFSFTGLPDILRMDNMGGFRAELIEALKEKLGIESRYGSPFYHRAQGTVERLNATVESVLRKCLMEEGSQWDQILPYINFALRECVHSSVGVSAAEMVFGYKFRGLLDVMRQSWISDDPITKYKKISTVQYIEQLRQRINKALTVAKANNVSAQARSKTQYDRHSSLRKLEIGELVLLLLPTSSSKMEVTWQGPFRLVGKRPNGNYDIMIGNRKATYHINLLRKYYVDDDANAARCMMVIDSPDGGGADDDLWAAAFDWTDSTGSDTAGTETTTERPIQFGQHLTEHQRDEIQQLIAEFPDVLTDKIGRTNLIEHVIEVVDEQPTFQKSYPIPEALKQQVHDEIQRMLENDVIQIDDDTQYNNPLIAIKKPNGQLRLVHNFIQLNKKTINRPHPMHDIREILNKVASAKFLTHIDIQVCYWQIPLGKNSQRYTGFTTPWGITYSYKVMPMGLRCASFTCQKLMDKILRGAHRFATSLLDDITVFSTDFDSHKNHVTDVLTRLRQAGLTANVRKCKFATNEMKLFGFEVKDGCITPDQEKVQAVAEWKLPNTKKKLRSFLGFTNFLREHIHKYSELAFELTEMLGKNKPDKILWTEKAIKSFEQLKQAVTMKPVVRSPNFKKPFYLMTDASCTAIGCVLMQPGDTENESPHVIAYASRKLLPRERIKSTVELELTAIAFGLTKFHVYLYNNSTTVFTDHRPLQWLNSLSKHSPRLARLNLIIQQYGITTTYVPGKIQPADALTRL